MVLLRALVCDRQIQNNWSEIQNIGTVQFIINEHVSTETSTSAFSLTFGELDKIYVRLPDNKDLSSAGDDYVSLLRANLESLRKTAAACITSKEYQRAGLLIPEMQNVFQEGDLILYDLKGPNKDFLPSKLTTPYKNDALGKLETEKPVDFVGFDNVIKFNKNRQNDDNVVKAYKS